MKTWFKQKLNWIVMGIAAVVTLSFIWTLIPGFSKLPNNVDNMRVAVVDRDNQQISQQMKKGLQNNLPFKEVTAKKTDAGIKKQIKNRDVSMVVIIPQGFSSDVQSGRPVQLKYYRGTANGMIETMARASATAKRATSQLTSKSEYVGTHHDNYKYQQTPMFFNMGQYLGMMLASIVLVILFTSARFAIGNKYTAFMSMQVSGILLATVTSIVASLALLCVEHVDNFMGMFGIAWLFDVAVFEISSMLALLCGGLPSIIIQLPLFTSQVIAGGAIVPRFAMSSFYNWLSKYTPMYQGIQATSNVMAGIGHTTPFISSLLWIAVMCCVLGFVFVWLGYRGKEPKGLSDLIPVKAQF